MTAELYSRDELPGVIADVNEQLAIANDLLNNPAHVLAVATNRVLEKLPRLLATLEAMAADAELLAWLESQAVKESGWGWNRWRIFVQTGLCELPTLREAIDAARREGG